VDPGEVPVLRLSCPLPGLAAPLLIIVLGGVVAGCGGKSGKSLSVKDAVRKELRGKKGEPPPPATITSEASRFTVDDAQGKRMIEATAAKVTGSMVAGKGMQGPVRMLNTKCRLFKNGKPDMDMESPEATWDPAKKQLTAEKQAHAVSADKKTILDGSRAVWTAQTGHLSLWDAKLQSMKGKQVDFNASAPRAEVQDNVANMTQGATGANSDGQRLTADRVKWHLDTAHLEADGHVVVTDADTRVTGAHLAADTKLKRGRMTGGTRTVMRQLVMPRVASAAKNPGQPLAGPHSISGARASVPPTLPRSPGTRDVR
jgi:hypothetical protein